MAIFNLILWIIVGILTIINDVAKNTDENYWKLVFWLTYVVLIVNLISKIF